MKKNKLFLNKTVLVLVTVLMVASVSYSVSADELSFEEDFSTPTLDPAWEVVPNLGSYSLTDNPGYLRYSFTGSRAYSGGWMQNYQQSGYWRPSLTLLRQFDGENWVLTTKADYNLHAHNSGSSTGAQRQTLWMALGEDTNDYIFLDRGIDWWYGHDSLLRVQLVSNGVSVAYFQGELVPIGSDGWGRDTYWYEITRNGEEISVRYSNDGITYTTAFTASLSEPVAATQRAIIDMSLWNSVGSYTDWDYINVEPIILDADGDGVADDVDNCPNEYNPSEPGSYEAVEAASIGLEAVLDGTDLTFNLNEGFNLGDNAYVWYLQVPIDEGAVINSLVAKNTLDWIVENVGISVDYPPTAELEFALKFVEYTYPPSTIWLKGSMGISCQDAEEADFYDGTEGILFEKGTPPGFLIDTSSYEEPPFSYACVRLASDHSKMWEIRNLNTDETTASFNVYRYYPATQKDIDNDGMGDVCDPDDDNDGVLDVNDLCSLEDASGFDANNDGCIDNIASFQQVIKDLPNNLLASQIKNSLLSKVDNALKLVDKEKDEAAINVLGAFINQVEAQSGKKISEETADMLIAYANNVIAQI